MESSLFDLRLFLPAKENPVAIGVSGGPDSMALAHRLCALARGPVHLLTVDHGLRADGAQEAARVSEWSKDWPHAAHAILKRELKEKPQSKLQEEARQDRYALLAAYCATHKIRHLFTAHHQDDQAETFLFRLAKGSGLDGLGAMRTVQIYNEKLEIIRPFLAVPKQTLLEYCDQHGIPYLRDPSNEDARFARARLRGAYDVLAAEGLTAKRLAVTAARLARGREALDYYADQAYKKALSEENSVRIVLNYSTLKFQPEEICLRVILKAMALTGPARPYAPRMEKCEALARRVFTDPDFKKSSLGGCLVERDDQNDCIIIETEKVQAT